MENIVLTTNPQENLTNSLLDKMVRIYATTPGLSRRSRVELKKRYKNREIIFALMGPEIAGWIIRSPLDDCFWEISGAYIEDRFRSKGLFKRMLESSLRPPAKYVTVTFLPTLADYLIECWGFHRVSLRETLYRTKGTFIRDRLHPLRIVSIVKQSRRARPFYLLRE